MIKIVNLTHNESEFTKELKITEHIKREEIIGITGDDYQKVQLVMRFLTGERTPDSGDIYYGKENVSQYGQVPSCTGVYVDEIGFIKDFDGFKNLKYIAGQNEMASVDEIYESMQLVGLNVRNKGPVKRYTKRMLHKLSLAQALMEGQEILLIDAGIFTEEQVKEHQEILKILSRLKKMKKTMVIATEKKEYIEKICTRMLTI